MIDKRYLVSVDLSSLNQGVVVSNASVSQTQVAATTFLTGPKGADGTPGTNGTNGVGVPVGGTTNQVLSKINDTNYNTQWVTPSSGSGTVTSVNGTGANGVSISGGPITTTGSLTIGLGAITPTSVASTGTVTGTNLSGTNTGDQNLTPYFNKSVDTSDAITQGTTNLFLTTAERTKLTNTSGTNTGDQTTVTGNAGTATTLQTARTIGTLTGDGTSAGSIFNGSANNTNVLTLATVNSNVGSFGSASSVGVQTVNAKGLTTAASSVAIQIAESQVTNLVSDLAAKQGTLTLTTTGTSGASTLVGNTLNIPNYAGGGGSAGITRSIATVSTTLTGGSTALVDYVYFLGTGAVYTQPTAVGNTNFYTLKNITTSNMTVNFTSGQTADGGTLVLAQDETVTLISDNANWRIGA